MGINEDIKPGQGSRTEEQGSDMPGDEVPLAQSAEDGGSPPLAGEGSERAADVDVRTPDEESAEPVAEPTGVASPTQLGAKRWVYAAYFAGAIAIAFLMSKVIGFAWYKLQSYKPAIGEPRDEIVMPVSALIGALAAVYYWYRTRARELAEEVAAEMAKVTWPSRDEVTNGTFVVIVTTIVSTVFFALMDKFWGFLTNLVYGGS
jgi:preprotein translocase subunit SecE